MDEMRPVSAKVSDSFSDQLKMLLKRSETIVHAYRTALWRLHVLKDWWGTKVWKRTVTVVTPLGFRLTSGFHPAYRMMREGTFEPEETSLLRSALKNVDVFVDVGANLGYYTCLALQSGVKVIAFEPQQQNLKCLFKNLAANGWSGSAEIFPMALGQAPGILTLFGASGPSASLVENWAGYSPRYRQVVPVQTMDNILQGRFLGARLLIKIDVEGAEYLVLRGASGVLAKSPKPIWMLEICLQEFHPGGVNPNYLQTFESFWNFGYEAFTVSRCPQLVTRENVAEWLANGASNSGTYNYLFVEKGKVPLEFGGNGSGAGAEI